MKYFEFGFLVFILAAMLSGCVLPINIGEDPFYRDDGGLNDYGRFPLIKPYDAMIVDKKNGWYVDLLVDPSKKAIYYYLGINDIRKIAIENGVIMVYTPYVKKVDEDVGQKTLSWFVIIPEQSIETGFDNEPDFLKYIQVYGIQEPTWEAPDDIYHQFKKTGCLDWIPSCK